MIKYFHKVPFHPLVSILFFVNVKRTDTPLLDSMVLVSFKSYTYVQKCMQANIANIAEFFHYRRYHRFRRYRKYRKSVSQILQISQISQTLKTPLQISQISHILIVPQKLRILRLIDDENK